MSLVIQLAYANKKYFKRLTVFFVLYTLLVMFHVRFLSFLYENSFEIFNKHSFLILYPMLLIFNYLQWSRIKTYKWESFKFREFLFFLFFSIVFFLLPPQKIVLLNVDPNIASLVPFYSGVSLMFAAIFGRKFIKKFGTELLIIAYILFAYIIAKMLIIYSWSYLVYGILALFNYIFPLISDNYLVALSTYNVRLENFSVNVGPTCAGIYSMVTFSLLYISSVTLLNRGSSKLNIRKTTLFFAIGLLGVYLLNILRVLIIVLVGAYISKTLAIKFFHEYLGAIFLIGVFLIYLYFVIPKLVDHSKHSSSSSHKL